MPGKIVVLLICCVSLLFLESSAISREPQTAPLIINEFLADPPDGIAGDANGDGLRDSTDDEFIELVNTGSIPLDVSGYTVSDAVQVRFTIPSGKIIPAGESAVVFGGGVPVGSFGNAGANGLVFAATGAGLSLNNGGDTITVKNNQGAVVDSLAYNSAEGNANQSINRNPDIVGINFAPHSTIAGSEGRLFSPGARVNGHPFVSTDPLIGSISPDAVVTGSGAVTLIITGENFQSASLALIDGTPASTSFISSSALSADLTQTVTASPGAHSITVENPDQIISNAVTFTVLSRVGINEYLADPPDGAAGDANGDGIRDSAQDEFVEVVNRASVPLGVGGFTVSDAAQTRFTFPASTSIPAGEAAIIFGGGVPAGEFGNAASNGLVFTASLSLNNGGDTITLKDNGGNILEAIQYGSVEGNANQSINRNPDILGIIFAPHSTITASGGRLFSPGAQLNGSPFTTGPRISQLDPESINLGSEPFDLSIRGSGFEADSVALIDSIPVATMFVSESELIALVPANVRVVAGDHPVRVRNTGGNRSNEAKLFIIPPPPVIRSVLPGVILTGSISRIFIAGENFVTSSVVLVDDSSVATTYLNAGELQATLPATVTATTGSHSIRVRNGDGQLSNTRGLQIALPTSQITAISPEQASSGDPGFILTVAGAHFLESAMVVFGQTPVETDFISAAQLQAHVSASLITDIGLRSVKVVNGDGSVSNEAAFRVLPVAPFVYSIEPESVIEGNDDLTITISGEKFEPGALVYVIENFQFRSNLDATFINSGQIEARLPARFLQVAGNVPIIVVNPDTGVSNSADFKVLIKDPLVINEYLADPANGDEGDANGDGTRSSSQDEFVEILNRTAAPIEISGFKLSDADSIRHVFADGTIVPPFEAVVVFGGGRPTGPFGNAAENKLVFKASSGGLSLNNGGDTIKLEDNRGHIIQEIKFGSREGNADQSLNRDPDMDGRIFSPHRAIAVTGRLFSPGTKTTGKPFTTKPSIQKMSPASVHAGSSGFTLMISGANFLPGARVIFGQASLETAYLSDAKITTQISAELISEGGATEVHVQNPRGELSSAAKFLIVDDPPHIALVTPDRIGTRAKNIEIAITGERFERGAVITIGGEKVETIFGARDSLKASVPDKYFERAALLEVRVINADTNQSNAVTLTIENGPLLTRLPKKIKVGAIAVEIAIGGLEFKPGIVLIINEVEVQTVFVSDTQITARIPAQLIATPGTLSLTARNRDGGRSNTAVIKVVQ